MDASNALQRMYRDKKFHKLAQPLVALSKELASNAEAKNCTDSIPTMNRQQFKDMSNEGAVFFGNHWYDLGNISYCVLFRLVLSHGYWLELGNTYGTLKLDASLTRNAIETQADVIECCLAQARLTGPAIDPETRSHRHAIMSLMS